MYDWPCNYDYKTQITYGCPWPANQIGNHLCPYGVLEAGRLGRCHLTKTSLVSGDRW